jgi:hypothetical protein
MNDTIELTEAQMARLWAGGNIVGLPLTCEFCEEPAVWSTGDDWQRRVACYDLRHIAGAESIGSAVNPEYYLSLLSKAQQA